jgi:hypothetical protein
MDVSRTRSLQRPEQVVAWPGSRVVLPGGAIGFTVYGDDGRAIHSFRRLGSKGTRSAKIPKVIGTAAQSVVVKFDYEKIVHESSTATKGGTV